jgi:hypothetical protein
VIKTDVKSDATHNRQAFLAQTRCLASNSARHKFLSFHPIGLVAHVLVPVSAAAGASAGLHGAATKKGDQKCEHIKL